MTNRATELGPVELGPVELGPVPIANSRRFTLHSQATGGEFVVDVSLPAPYLPGEAPWPIMLVLDGDAAFPATAGLSQTLPLEPGGPRAACVVGIGYAGDGTGDAGAHFSLRYRDLSPVRDEAWEAQMRAAPPPFGLPDGAQTGGGEAFLDFLIDELMPFLGETFPVDTSDCTLAGGSLGGALALHALFTRPGSFARHLAISPSLWWAGGYLLSLEAEYASAHDDLRAQIYLCVGGAEEAQAPQARMVSNCEIFAQTLRGRGYPSLGITSQVLPSETHLSVASPAMSRGYRYLLGAQPDEG